MYYLQRRLLFIRRHTQHRTRFNLESRNRGRYYFSDFIYFNIMARKNVYDDRISTIDPKSLFFHGEKAVSLSWGSMPILRKYGKCALLNYLNII